MKNSNVKADNGNMVKVVNKSGKYDFVKREMLGHFIKTGYVVAVA